MSDYEEASDTPTEIRATLPLKQQKETTRVITTSRDSYGMDTQTLRERLVTITGSEAGADDALAAVAEWLDTAKYAAHAFTKKTQVHHLPKKAVLKRRRIRNRVASVAAHFAETLAVDLESHVADSAYALVPGENGQMVRRRVLQEVVF